MRADPEFQELYRSERQAVFSTVYLLWGTGALAEDATQEAFARGLERWSRPRAGPGQDREPTGANHRGRETVC